MTIHSANVTGCASICHHGLEAVMDGMDYMCWFEGGDDQRVAGKRYRTKHGGWAISPRLYNIWKGIMARCRNPNTSQYASYGGVGIDICDEWAIGPLPFIRWALANGYRDGLTLDRINNADGYGPGNCRWATAAQQCRNRKSNIYITFKGKTQCLTDWAADVGIPRQVLRQRVQFLGWSIERALTEPVGTNANGVLTHPRPAALIDYGPETRTVADWAAIAGVTKDTIWARKRKGQPLGASSQKPWLNTETALLAVKNRKRRRVDGSS